MSIVAGSDITIATAKMEGDIAQCCKAWAVAFPHEILALRRKVADTRRHLYNQGRRGGISRGKSMLHKAEIPVKLNNLMCRKFGNDWIYDPERRNRFFRIFKAGLVNMTSESQR